MAHGSYIYFGPMIGHYRLSESAVDSILTSSKSDLSDNSRRLVGKVTQEKKFDNDIAKNVLTHTAPFIFDYQRNNHHRKYFDNKMTESGEIGYQVKYLDGWFVEQLAGDYNPIHWHPASDYSCVGYVNIPKELQQEWEAEEKEGKPAYNGQIHFLQGFPHAQSPSNIKIKPQAGDFFIFPASLLHCVYPFRSSSLRLSFSMNFNVKKITGKNEILL